jgi:predicted nucleic acid-binding protein
VIAADTSTWVAYLQGEHGEDVQVLEEALQDRQLLMIPVVLSELLSDPKLPSPVAQSLTEIPPIEITAGFWKRAGLLRAKVLAKNRKARLADAMIAQICIDRSIALLTRDRDFRAFAEAAKLGLVVRTRPD